MRDRRNPWKWPAATAAAVVILFGGVLLTPRAWIEFFFSPLNLGDYETAVQGRGWLELVPPPEIRVAEPRAADRPDRPEPPPVEWANPDWWQKGWRVRTETVTAADLRPTPRDSVAVLLKELGVGQDLLTMVRPDSVLAVRLRLLQLEDSYRFDQLKPYLLAMGRADAYRDLQSRVADMYDDFLHREVIVPD